MEDETLNNIINLLQNATGSNSNNFNNTNNTPPPNNNNFNNSNLDIQNLLIKFLLSGGLNQILGSRNQNTNSSSQTPPTPEPEKPRTIDLINYQRLD